MTDVPPREVADDPIPAAGAAPASPASGVARSGVARSEVPHVRVDARLLEATLLNLRKRVAAIPLVFDVPGAAGVAEERAKLLSQIDDYLLPRVRQSAAPVLVALVGSTGAGKSTLVNSIVGSQVSATGVRRPTTNSPVLACHPDDIGWFAENLFLPTLPRVRQEGLAMPGRDGLLVLAASAGMPKGIALLDTPDIDSVVSAHHEFAYQFLDASDLWLFMTSAVRYADAPVWEILQHARERGAALGVVLSRVPPGHRTELASHFTAMLDANGITARDRFVIPETGIVDGMLPTEVFGPVRDWLADTAQRSDRRVAVLTQTMSGVLDTFRTRVPRLAAHVEAQLALRAALRRDAESAYRRALAGFDAGTRDGSLLSGEITARWQDYAVSGELGAALRSRRAPRKGRRARRGQAARGQGVSRTAALDASVRSALESLVVSVADHAAEQAAACWRADQAGAALLARAAAARAEGERAEQVFESVFGPDAGAGGTHGAEQQPVSLDRSSHDLPPRVARAVSAWQDLLMRLVQEENQAKRGGGRPDYDSEPLSLVMLVALLGEQAAGGAEQAAAPRAAGQRAAGQRAAGQRAGVAGADADVVTVPRELLTSVFGAAGLAEITARARADLLERVRLLLDEELLRFAEVIDSAGTIDDVAAVRLYQAEYSLEAAR